MRKALGWAASITSVQDVLLFNSEGEYYTEQQQETDQQYRIAMIIVGQRSWLELENEQTRKITNNMERNSSSSSDADTVVENDEGGGFDDKVMLSSQLTTQGSEASCCSTQLVTESLTESFHPSAHFFERFLFFWELSTLINSPSSSTATSDDYYVSPQLYSQARQQIYDDPFSLIKEVQQGNIENADAHPEYAISLTTTCNTDKNVLPAAEPFSSELNFAHILSPPPSLYEVERQPFQMDWSLFNQ